MTTVPEQVPEPDSGSVTDTVTDTVTAVAGKLRRGLRLFASGGDQPRARRATDVILLIVSFVGIVLVGLVAIPEPGISNAVTRFLLAFPDALIGLWELFADMPTVWAAVILVAAFARGRAEGRARHAPRHRRRRRHVVPAGPGRHRRLAGHAAAVR